MITQAFSSGEELRRYCREQGITIAEAMQRREEHLSEMSREEIRAEMYKNLVVMRESVYKGLSEKVESVSGLSGGEAAMLFKYGKYSPFSGTNACRAAAAAMAVVEVNASMGCIVAAPTAGASGILPGVLIESARERGWSDEQLVDALFTAGAIGLLFAENATISGADGGCQAELRRWQRRRLSKPAEARPCRRLTQRQWRSKMSLALYAIRSRVSWNAPVSNEMLWALSMR